MNIFFKRFLIILLIVFLGFILTDTFVIKGSRKISKIILKPITAPFEFIGQKTSNFFIFFKESKNLTNENNQLKKENNNLAAENVKLKETIRQNEILAKESAANPNLLAAPIISKSSTGFLKTLTISKGSESGISQNQAVINNGFLVGKITKVEKNSAEVSLITNPSLLIPATLESSRGTGILKGSLSGIVVEEISNDTKIQVGENVITNGLGNEISPNILVGKVEKIISKESEIFQKIIISSPIAFSRLDTVFIVK